MPQTGQCVSVQHAVLNVQRGGGFNKVNIDRDRKGLVGKRRKLQRLGREDIIFEMFVCVVFLHNINGTLIRLTVSDWIRGNKSVRFVVHSSGQSMKPTSLICMNGQLKLAAQIVTTECNYFSCLQCL